MKKHVLFAAIALLCIALSPLGSFAQDIVDPATVKSPYSQKNAEVVFTAASPVAEDSVNHYIVWQAKHLMEEKSKGRIFVNIYEAGTLGGDRETIEGLQAGTIDFFVTISPIFAPFAPRTGIFDLPNLFPDLGVARKVLNGDFLKEVEPDYAAAGFKIFGFADAGFRQTTSNKPVTGIGDFQGLKIRTMENPNHIAYWKSLGASPTPMDFGELYISLQQGTIDAQENPYDLIVANKLYEPQKYMIETNHHIHNLTMMMSKVKYDALPDDLKRIVEEAVTEAMAYGCEVADMRIDSRRQIVSDYGCEILTISPELRQTMIEKAPPVYDKIRKEIGSDLVDKLLNAIADAEKN